jgi:hypothetical protein
VGGMRKILTIISAPVLTTVLGVWAVLKLILDNFGRADVLQGAATKDGIVGKGVDWLFSTPWWAPGIVAALTFLFWAYLVHKALIAHKSTEMVAPAPDHEPTHFGAIERTATVKTTAWENTIFGREMLIAGMAGKDAFSREEIYLGDIVRDGPPLISGKTFVKCHFLGPGFLKMHDNVRMGFCSVSDGKAFLTLPEGEGSPIIGAIFLSNSGLGSAISKKSPLLAPLQIHGTCFQPLMLYR